MKNLSNYDIYFPVDNDEGESKEEPKIIRNRAKCLRCGDILESKYRHDFKICSCGKLSVDGGTAYIRRVGNFEEFEELSEYAPAET
jgi:hypothetical protein